jgi:hypothetical protein
MREKIAFVERLKCMIEPTVYKRGYVFRLKHPSIKDGRSINDG